jgi:uncharacterized protein (UPF0276 family)
LSARIATAVSRLFQDPVAARRLAAASDCLELRKGGCPAEVAAGRPLLYHCEQSLLKALDLGAFRRYIERLPPDARLELVSFHAPSCYASPLLDNGVYLPGGRRLRRSEMLEHARRNAEAVRRLLPATTIAVENNNYLSTSAYDHVTDPDFLVELVEGADVGLLLDLAHAQITARRRGVAPDAYLEALPLGRTVQLHVSSCRVEHGVWVDSHDSPTADDWREVARLLARAPAVRYLTIEYHREAEGLLEALRVARSVLAGAEVAR